MQLFNFRHNQLMVIAESGGGHVPDAHEYVPQDPVAQALLARYQADMSDSAAVLEVLKLVATRSV